MSVNGMRILLVAFPIVSLVACSEEQGSDGEAGTGNVGVGGAPGGGTTPGTGGTGAIAATGGTPYGVGGSATGGTAAATSGGIGGTPPIGGGGTGAIATGGVGAVGVTGGAPTGGVGTGGVVTGATAGVGTGGTGATRGSQTGGVGTGGVVTGVTGGVGTGGTGETGGSQTGGVGTGSAGAGATGGSSTGGAGTGGGGTGGAVVSKPRLINTTDMGGDPDDEQSMVHQLVTSNEFDLEGLIRTTGCWKKQESSTDMLDRIVNAYGEVLSNLRVHAEGYPSLEYVRSISVLGQTGYGMDDVGDGRDSAGSELIIAAVDKDDPRPVWATCWGGCNTIAQALWKVRQTRSQGELDQFVSKLRVYDILGQDNAGTWIAKTFPSLLYIRATYGVFGWPPGDGWLAEHVQSHGPLGAVYPDRAYSTEGDSPAFLHVYPNGLNDPEQVDQGGWGGRFDPNKKTGIRGMQCMDGEDQAYDPYEMYGDASEGQAAITRWSTAINNDLQARMDWSVTSNYGEANHHPIALVNGDNSRQVLEVSASAGSSVELSAAGSSDPDGDGLSYSWWIYDEPSSGSGSIQKDSSESATVSVSSGGEIHVILEVVDNGSPSLTAYRRVIINVQ